MDGLPLSAARRPRVLFLCHRIPYPPDKGDKIRSWQLFRHLCSRAEVHLGCFVDDPSDGAHRPRLEGMAASCCFRPLTPRLAKVRALSGLATGAPLTLPYYADGRLRAWVRRTVAAAAPDLAVAFSSAMAPYLKGLPEGTATLLDMVDVDSAKWRAYADQRGGLGRFIYGREGRRLAEAERRFAETCDATLIISEPERALLGSAAPRARVLGNGTDLDLFDPARAMPSPFPEGVLPLVFTGAMDYPPNAEAAVWFTRHVLPEVRASHPRAEFWIVGARPTREVRALAEAPGVVVTGRVPEMPPYLAHAALAVAPLRTARGVQNKVLEAMAMARTVVATPAAFEGIDAAPGRELCIAAAADAQARTIVALLSDPARRTAIGQAARRRMERDYGWAARMAEVDDLLAGLVPGWPRAAPAASCLAPKGANCVSDKLSMRVPGGCYGTVPHPEPVEG
jgi:sugar transferase (PEP-CTERM/EpsH1 system associated)